jgi:acetyl-CoA carboxylase carboxyltransferase component
VAYDRESVDTYRAELYRSHPKTASRDTLAAVVTIDIVEPLLVEFALGVEGTRRALGGSEFYTGRDMADCECDDGACLDAIRRYFSYLPWNE